MKEVELPSGALLKIDVAPFAEAKALYQAILNEMKSVTIDLADEATNLFKNLFCAGFTSPEVERCLNECFKRCTYAADGGPNGLKIDKDTFEPVDARQDYLVVCLEVAKENIAPFVKSLSAEFKKALSTIEGFRP